MKAALLIFAFIAAFVVVSALPAETEEDIDRPTYPWYNNYSYQYMMCRMKCRQSCLEQGYWKGVCKQGACYCFGPMGPYGRMNGFPMTNF